MIDTNIKKFNWFIIDEFYGKQGEFTYVLAHVLYDDLAMQAGQYVAKCVDYYFARELAPNIYIAYEGLCPVFDNLSLIEELGCPIDERGKVYVSAKTQKYQA